MLASVDANAANLKVIPLPGSRVGDLSHMNCLGKGKPCIKSSDLEPSHWNLNLYQLMRFHLFGTYHSLMPIVQSALQSDIGDEE